MCADTVCELDDLRHDVPGLFEVDEVLGAHFETEFLLFGTGVDDDGPESHCFGELDALNADAAAAAGEDDPFAWLELGFDEGAVDGAGGTHDGAGDEVVDAVGDGGCVA